jgi:TRAP-type C4-dicarboxylate transport system permease small subunit
VQWLARAQGVFERLLEAILIFFMVALTVVVVVAVIYRKAGASLAWYDEVASVMLAWITYYGAALAALKRGHIGFDGMILALPERWKLAALLIAEICVYAFFLLLAWTGWIVLKVLEGDTLVSLPEVSVQITQSVIPIGAVLFLVCETLSLPAYWRRLQAGISHELPPIDPDSGQAEP